jgi:UDP-3-O-[3-hydroxymyristoyl] glucosamine N-acyltransferase
MKLPKPLRLKEIAHIINAELIGDPEFQVLGMNEIHKVEKGDITFSDLQKYFKVSLESNASVVILNERVECPPGKHLLIHPEPFMAYNTLISKFTHFMPLQSGIIAPTANIHPDAIIEPGAIVGHNVTIGAHSYIQGGAYIGNETIIGSYVNIQAGAIVGTDAFYFKKQPDKYIKWVTAGRVVIGDRVEIGAGCTINRCVSGDTYIGDGTKFDSLIHIGHGAVIGKNCLFAAQVGIGGNTIIEDNVVLYGQVGVAQNLTIGAGAVVLAKSGVSKDLEGGKVYFGIPAAEARDKYRELAALRMLPDNLRHKIEI